MTAYRTVAGDSVDLIVWRELGTSAGLAEAMFEANPGLADRGPVLEAGLVLTLPAPPPATAARKIRLYD